MYKSVGPPTTPRTALIREMLLPSKSGGLGNKQGREIKEYIATTASSGCLGNLLVREFNSITVKASPLPSTVRRKKDDI